MPCRLGTNQIHTLLDKIAAGNGSTNDLAKLEDVCHWMQTITLCGLGQTAPNTVISALTYFRHEFESLIQSSQTAEMRAG
jgi:NADH:ubiquinone oxidoreductase subunit F (NADH-binding)